jgi:hypothetical protein
MVTGPLPFSQKQKLLLLNPLFPGQGSVDGSSPCGSIRLGLRISLRSISMQLFRRWLGEPFPLAWGHATGHPSTTVMRLQQFPGPSSANSLACCFLFSSFCLSRPGSFRASPFAGCRSFFSFPLSWHKSSSSTLWSASLSSANVVSCRRAPPSATSTGKNRR